jgi:hypothetical protein
MLHSHVQFTSHCVSCLHCRYAAQRSSATASATESGLNDFLASVSGLPDGQRKAAIECVPPPRAAPVTPTTHPPCRSALLSTRSALACPQFKAANASSAAVIFGALSLCKFPPRCHSRRPDFPLPPFPISCPAPPSTGTHGDYVY